MSWQKSFEQEFLLPPCEYEIISSREIKPGNEPNNHTGKTRLLEITVKPLNLLEEFLKVMENPPEEYLQIRYMQDKVYEEALKLLRNYINNKNKDGKPKQKTNYKPHY